MGKKIWKLEVIDEKRENNRLLWKCRCECGNEKWIRADSIKSGRQKSCGCLRKATEIKSKDITGIKYSRLTPLKYISGKGENEIWLCKCQCGNEVKVLKKNIYSSSKNSCGCMALKQKIAAAKVAQKRLKEIDLFEGTALSKINREKPIKSNTSGVMGVRWDSNRKKWYVDIEFKGKRHYLGRYEDKDEAIRVRKEAEEKYFKPIIEKYK